MLYKILSFLTLIMVAVATSQSSSKNISLDSSLSSVNDPTAWFSPSGHFTFGFYPEGTGFRIGVWLLMASPESKTVTWTAKRDHPPFPKSSSLKLTDKGLVLLQKNAEDIVISTFSGNAFSASMLDSGNFIISDATFGVLWQTFDFPTDTIVSGQSLSAPNQLISSKSGSDHSNGKFRIKMQHDSNLVMYPVQTTDVRTDAYWATMTSGSSYSNLDLSSDGMLYLIVNTNTTTIHNLASNMTSGPGVFYRATIDVDGIFRLYSHDLNSNTTNVLANFLPDKDHCKIKGTCGLNSYCTLVNNKPECSCLPGFDYVDDKEKSDGCIRIAGFEGCPADNNVMMQNITNIVWDNKEYITMPTPSPENCRYACLQDCSCEVAFFINDKCHKQELPLKYGYRNTSDSTITFIKTSSSNSESVSVSPTLSLSIQIKIIGAI